MASNPKTASTESVYSAAELAANHHLFGTSREIVVIALRKAGKASATVAEAKAIIDKFKSRKVGTNPKKEAK